jgi:hypothetical protein
MTTSASAPQALARTNICRSISTKGRLLQGLLMLMVLVGVLSPTHAWAAWPSSADYISQTLVFAEMHPWEANPTIDGYWSRWNDWGQNPGNNDIMSTFWPTRGAYSAGDCGTVASLGSDLGRAAVDVAVILWVNLYPGEQTRVERLLQCLGKPVVVMVEPQWNNPSFQEAVTRLETVIGWYSRRTDLYPNYYRDPLTNYPVYFVWDPGAVGSVADWNTKINYYKTSTPEHGIFIAGLGGSTSPDWCAQSYFDGCLGLPAKTSTSDQGNYQWAIWRIHAAGSWNQFFVGGVIPGFDSSANCGTNFPVVDRQNGAVFETKWAGVRDTNWSGYKAPHAFVGYHNDGEDAGIEPVSSSPPLRGAGLPYQNCGGRIGPYYNTYAPLAPTYYLDRNAYWVNQFKATR